MIKRRFNIVDEQSESLFYIFSVVFRDLLIFSQAIPRFSQVRCPSSASCLCLFPPILYQLNVVMRELRVISRSRTGCLVLHNGHHPPFHMSSYEINHWPLPVVSFISWMGARRHSFCFLFFPFVLSYKLCFHIFIFALE